MRILPLDFPMILHGRSRNVFAAGSNYLLTVIRVHEACFQEFLQQLRTVLLQRSLG